MLRDCSYTVTVVASDLAGNADPNPAHVALAVDTIAPSTTFTQVPPTYINVTTASVAIGASEPVDGFWVAVVPGLVAPGNVTGGDVWVPAATPTHTMTGLAPGWHTVLAWGRDVAGNSNATRAAVTAFSVDLTPPTPTLELGPATPFSNDTTPTLRLACPLEHAGCAFALDAGGGDVSLPLGTVVLTGVSGTAGAPTQAIDVNVPRPQAADADLGTAMLARELAFSTLPGDGAYAVVVRVTDAAGNTRAAPLVHAWTLDTVAPRTHTAAGGDGGPRLGMAPVEPTVRLPIDVACTPDEVALPCAFTAVLDGAVVVTVGAGQALLPETSPGHHTVTVTAVDAAGNVELAPVTVPVDVDVEPPTVEVVEGPPQ